MAWSRRLDGLRPARCAKPSHKKHRRAERANCCVDRPPDRTAHFWLRDVAYASPLPSCAHREPVKTRQSIKSSLCPPAWRIHPPHPPNSSATMVCFGAGARGPGSLGVGARCGNGLFSTYKSPKFYLSFTILVSLILVKYPDRVGLVNTGTYGTVP